MGKADYATWVTKQQAAEMIGVTTKTIEKLAQNKQLEQALWKRPTGGPRLAVYNPDDVARLAQQPPPAPFVLPAGQMMPGTNGGAGLVRTDDGVRVFLTRLQDLLYSAASQNSEKLFLTLAEASAHSGLSQAYLRRAITAGTLPAIRDRGYRIRRKDLDAL